MDTAAVASSEVERIRELPASIDELVREGLAEGFLFVERLRDDWRAGANRFEGPGEAFFAAHVNGTLAGVCGLNRDPYAGDPRCGRLRRLYVRASQRRRGLASALTRAALAEARGRFSQVRLRSLDPQAAAFYRALGFAAVEGDAFASHVRRP